MFVQSAYPRSVIRIERFMSAGCRYSCRAPESFLISVEQARQPAKGLKGVININRGPTIDPRRAVPGLIPAEGFIRSSSFEGNRLLKMPLTPVIGSIYFLPIPFPTGIGPPRGPSACSADFILLLSRPSIFQNRSIARLGKFLQSLPLVPSYPFVSRNES